MTIERKIGIKSWEHPAETLPKDIRAILTESELNAYATGATYFQKLAVDSDCEQLVNLLNRLNPNAPMFVDLHQVDDGPWHVWFGFTIAPMLYHPRLLLPRQIQIPKTAPERVRKLYSSFGGICESNYIGGFMTPEDISRGANDFVMSHHELRLPDGSYMFFSYGNGDYAGWLPDGRGCIYNHETGETHDCEFDRLWESLLADMKRTIFDE